MSVSHSSSSKLRLVRTLAASFSVMPAAGMTAMGLGLIDIDPKLANVALVYTEPLSLPLQPFLVFVGVTKILSVLRLWGVFKGIPKTLAWIGLASPAAAATYGHAKAEGSMVGSIPPILYLCNLAFCHYLETKVGGKANSKNY